MARKGPAPPKRQEDIMSTATGTVTLNAAFFQEIKEDNQRLQELQRELREIFHADRPLGVSRFTLIDLLAELRDHLATHFALEEAFGYFDDPIDTAPQICEEAETLRAQHSDLFVEVCHLADRAVDLLGEHGTLAGYREIARMFREFDHRLRQHEARENELILLAFNNDIGIGD
jgi:hypothetical protein